MNKFKNFIFMVTSVFAFNSGLAMANTENSISENKVENKDFLDRFVEATSKAVPIPVNKNLMINKIYREENNLYFISTFNMKESLSDEEVVLVRKEAQKSFNEEEVCRNFEQFSNSTVNNEKVVVNYVFNKKNGEELFKFKVDLDNC